MNDKGFAGSIVAAEFEGKLIGIQPISFFEWEWGKRRLTGAMYTGVLTHPDHRRRGVFQSLIESSNELSAQRGAQFCMTMPNDASLPGFMKFGDWKYPGCIPMWLKVLDGAALLAGKFGTAGRLAGWIPDLYFSARKGRASANFNMEVEPTSRVSDELDNVLEPFSERITGCMIRRSAAYWNWRYSGPLSNYQTFVAWRQGRLCGAVCTASRKRMGMEVGLIVDIVADDLPVLRRLIAAADDDLKRRGCALVTCQATQPFLATVLRAEGYSMPPGFLVPKKFHLVYRLTGVAGLPHEPERISDWHLTFGDSDNV